MIAVIYWLTLPTKEKIRIAIFGLIAGVTTYLLVKVGASLYFDPRPFVKHSVTPLYPHSADNGFPSDHTALTAFTALTIFSSARRLGLILLGTSVLIGVSRVIGNIHSPVDIAGSLIIAAIGAVAAYYLTPVLMYRVVK
jgi:undecaprenyl-diphosphatase